MASILWNTQSKKNKTQKHKNIYIVSINEHEGKIKIKIKYNCLVISMWILKTCKNMCLIDNYMPPKNKCGKKIISYYSI